MSECDGEAAIMRRPWPTGGCCVTKKRSLFIVDLNTLSESASILLIWNCRRMKSEWINPYRTNVENRVSS